MVDLPDQFGIGGFPTSRTGGSSTAGSEDLGSYTEHDHPSSAETAGGQMNRAARSVRGSVIG